MNKQLVQIPASVYDMRPRQDKSWKLTFETAHELSGEDVKVLTDNLQGDGWLVFSPNEISTADIPDTEVEDTGKSPSQRLRGLLYVLWEKKGKHGEFEMFYRVAMDRLINKIREDLEKVT